MKLTKYLALGIMTVLMAACSDDKFNDVRPSDSGTVTDRDGNTYEWVRIGDLQWTTSNARCGTPMGQYRFVDNQGSTRWTFATEDERKALETDYYPVYGNLLTIEEALQSTPDGWRLPTDEDWQNLEKLLGVKNTGSKGARGEGVAPILTEKDGCGLELMFGGAILPRKVWGWFQRDFVRLDSFGYYWTSSEENRPEDPTNKYYYYRRINSYDGAIDRESTVNQCLMSVRWVRDVE